MSLLTKPIIDWNKITKTPTLHLINYEMSLLTKIIIHSNKITKALSWKRMKCVRSKNPIRDGNKITDINSKFD